VKAMPTVFVRPKYGFFGLQRLSAQLGAKLGLGFCVAHQYSDITQIAALRRYRDLFRPPNISRTKGARGPGIGGRARETENAPRKSHAL